MKASSPSICEVSFGRANYDRNQFVQNLHILLATGKVYQVDYFNLDAVLSVGYRVNSRRGTLVRPY